jgi:hypothetical protein
MSILYHIGGGKYEENYIFYSCGIGKCSDG